jgi:hypothetical protein
MTYIIRNKIMLKSLLTICAALLLTLLPIKGVLACKCAMGQTERSRFNDAEYVAHVKITATELRDSSELGNDASDFSTEYVRVSFEEMEVFKKPKFSPDHLKEFPYANGNCTIGLMPGLEYVVFLAKESMGFVANCSGTFGVDNAGTSEEISPRIKKLREWVKKGR